MKFKKLLDSYHTKNLKLSKILSYIHQKGSDKAYRKFTEHNFQFLTFKSFSLPNNITNEDIINHLSFLTIFGFDFKVLTLANLYNYNNVDDFYFLIDYLLEKNILVFDVNSDGDLDALGSLNLEYFKKIVTYFNLNLQALYGKPPLTLYFYVNSEELINYLYSEGVDIYHDLNGKLFYDWMLPYMLPKIDLNRLNHDFIYSCFYRLKDSDIFEDNPDLGEILIDKLIEHILSFDKQDLNKHPYLLIELEDYPKIEKILKRYAEEGISSEKVLLDFLERDFAFVKQNYQLLKEIYGIDLKDEKIDFGEIQRKLLENLNKNEKGDVTINKHLTDVKFYILGYILYKYQNNYLEEYIEYFIRYYFAEFIKEEIENGEDLQIDEVFNIYKLMILSGFEKGLILSKILGKVYQHLKNVMESEGMASQSDA